MANSNSTSKEKLEQLRAVMVDKGLDGFLLDTSDEFQSEYPPEHTKRLAWLTGFTGSNGFAVILKDKAIAITDGRYTAQIKQQVSRELYEIVELKTANTLAEVMKENIQDGSVVGYDPNVFTIGRIDRLREKAPGVEFRAVDKNLIDMVWEDRPQENMDGLIEVFPENVAGQTSSEKRGVVQKVLHEEGAQAVVISSPASVCWLLNVRGNDTPTIPVSFSRALVHEDGSVDWFVDPQKVTPEVKDHLGGGVRVRKPSELKDVMNAIAGQKVLVAGDSTPDVFRTSLDAVNSEISIGVDPCETPKAIKTKSEIEAIKRTHIVDGVAVTRLLHWFSQEVPKGKLSEMSVVLKLDEFRSENEAYRGVSFTTISGFGENGAIIHYGATPEKHSDINGDGLLLLDSGGQYGKGDLYGTTDITRTVVVGEAVPEMRKHFTLVLKGHIDLAKAVFPQGTTGLELDGYARQPLLDEGLDYAHGTGHGVGCYLDVHEGPTRISRAGECPEMVAGMLVSNEPGYYKEGEYGIRIENLILCVEKGDGLAFETVSLAPIDRSLIVAAMLSDAQRQWLNDYHARVYKTLSPLLPEDTAAWLREQTLAI